MKSIIIDDEAAALAIVEELCLKHSNINVLAKFSNGIEAVKYLNQNDPIDLIFLDIHMPNFSGIDFIQTIKNPPQIILTTSDSNFAIQAFEYDFIIGYLVKPITLDRFKKAVTKAKLVTSSTAPNAKSSNEKAATSVKHLYININKRLIKINISNIYIIEAKGDYITIKLEEKTYIVHSSLKKIEEKLPQDLFLKVHRSFIINTTKIIDIKDNTVYIKKDIIPVSRSNRPELMKRLNLL